MFRLIGVLALLVFSNCKTMDPNLLASFQGGVVTVAELETFIRGLPAHERQMPAAPQLEPWLIDRLESLALQRLILADEAFQARTQSAEAKTGRDWLLAVALAEAETKRLFDQLPPPDEAALSDRVEALAERWQEDRFYHFRHITLRKDEQRLQPTVEDVALLAEVVLARARAGEDFEALVREFSQSATRENGGLVENARLKDLDPSLGEILQNLEEGGVSEVINSRSGFHIFKLEGVDQPVFDQHNAIEQATQELLLGDRQRALAIRLEELRQLVTITREPNRLTVGPWSFEHEDIDALLPNAAPAQRPQQAERMLLLAQGARQHNLETPEMRLAAENRVNNQYLAAAFQERLAAFAATIDEAVLRQFFNVQPNRFALGDQFQVDLIWVPQGNDSFAMQQRLEPEVSALRDGADFAQTAAKWSRGPAADRGGALGWVHRRDLVRLHPEILSAVLELKDGKVAGPIYCAAGTMTQETAVLRGGFAIVRRRGHQAGEQPVFEAVIEQVRQAYIASEQMSLSRQLTRQILDRHGFRIVRLPEPEELSL